MKKFLFALITSFMLIVGMASCSTVERMSYQTAHAKEPNIEIVNDKTIILKNVIKIEILTPRKEQVTYVYDLKHSKRVKVARGTFNVEVPCGDYLVLSDRKITKTLYEIIPE
jgi:hypothetical protein